MKKTGLAKAIAARKAVNAPEPELKAETRASAQIKVVPKRFHTTLYPDPDLYRKIKIALLEENEGRDFNQLVNELLAQWYAEHGED